MTRSRREEEKGGGGREGGGGESTHFHEDEEAGKEEQCSPLYLVQNGLKVLDICEDQQHHTPKDGNPPWKRTWDILTHEHCRVRVAVTD